MNCISDYDPGPHSIMRWIKFNPNGNGWYLFYQQYCFNWNEI